MISNSHTYHSHQNVPNVQFTYIEEPLVEHFDVSMYDLQCQQLVVSVIDPDNKV